MGREQADLPADTSALPALESLFGLRLLAVPVAGGGWALAARRLEAAA